MKKITFLLSGLFIFSSLNLVANDDILFVEHFQNVTEIWYGNTAINAEDYDTYFDNTGWTGQNVCLGTTAAPGTTSLLFNEVPAARVGSWKGNGDHLTTPTIDSSAEGGVSLSFNLKGVARGNYASSAWCDPRVNVMHAADGVNFILLETVTIPKNTTSDRHSFTAFSVPVIDGAANSKFRFQVFQNTDPNAFFIDDVIVKKTIGTSIESNKIEDNITVLLDEIQINNEALYTKINVLDLLGTVVAQANASSIDISKLPKGVYILQVEENSGKAASLKFVRR